VSGFITRTFTDATPTQVEAITIIGVYNGSTLNVSVDFSGDDTELEFTVSGGQFGFKYLKVANTDEVKIKYKAVAIVDSSFFA